MSAVIAPVVDKAVYAERVPANELHQNYDGKMPGYFRLQSGVLGSLAGDAVILVAFMCRRVLLVVVTAVNVMSIASTSLPIAFFARLVIVISVAFHIV